MTTWFHPDIDDDDYIDDDDFDPDDEPFPGSPTDAVNAIWAVLKPILIDANRSITHPPTSHTEETN